MTWEQSIPPQISNTFLAARWASSMARCFTFGKLFHPSVPWFPAPKRRGIRSYSVSAALQVVLERSRGEPRLGSPRGVWVPSPQRAQLPGNVRETASLCSVKTCEKNLKLST